MSVNGVVPEYNAFMVNRFLSLHPDTIAEAYQATQMWQLDNDMQYTYLLHSVRRRKRFAKMPKSVTDDNIKLVSDHYNVSMKRAVEYLALLTPEDLQKITDSKKVQDWKKE